MNNIYEISSRTRSKIIARMNLACSSCGWNKARCDIHHIIPISKGGSNNHDNLTCLCPNCHRLFHNKIKIIYKSLQDDIGDSWINFYAQSNVSKVRKKGIPKKTSDSLKRKWIEEANKKLSIMKNSDIDFSKYGWVEKVGELINIRHQHVTRFIKKYDLDFYINSCYKRHKFNAEARQE